MAWVGAFIGAGYDVVMSLCYEVFFASFLNWRKGEGESVIKGWGYGEVSAVVGEGIRGRVIDMGTWSLGTWVRSRGRK